MSYYFIDRYTYKFKVINLVKKIKVWFILMAMCQAKIKIFFKKFQKSLLKEN